MLDLEQWTKPTWLGAANRALCAIRPGLDLGGTSPNRPDQCLRSAAVTDHGRPGTQPNPYQRPWLPNGIEEHQDVDLRSRSSEQTRKSSNPHVATWSIGDSRRHLAGDRCCDFGVASTRDRSNIDQEFRTRRSALGTGSPGGAGRRQRLQDFRSLVLSRQLDEVLECRIIGAVDGLPLSYRARPLSTRLGSI